MNKVSKVLLCSLFVFSLQGCKDLARDLFGFEEQVDVDELVALDVRVTDSDVVQEQTDWSIRADINLSVGDLAPEYQMNWQIVDAPVGFSMGLNPIPANDEGQSFLEFTTPDVDVDTNITLQLTVNYNNGDSDEEIVKDVNVLIEANQEVVISGAVVDEPIPFALVTIKVGDLVFETVADGNGNYTIELEFKDNNLIAVVTAVGTGENDDVEFKSYLGDGESLQRSAGADGIVTPDENNNANVSNVSTAEFVLIENVLEEGEEIGSQEQLDDLTSQLDVQEVLKVAAIIKAVIDDDVELPEGTNTVLELLRDEEAAEEFVDELVANNPNAIDDLIQQIIEDPVLTPEDTLFNYEDKFFLTRLGNYQNLATEIIDLEDDETGTWSTSFGTFDVTWQKSEGIVTVNFIDMQAWISTDCDFEGMNCKDRYLHSANIKKLPATGAYVSMLVDYEYKLVDTETSEVAFERARDTYSALTDTDLIPLKSADLIASQWVIRVLDESLDNSSWTSAGLPFESVYASFNEDGTGTFTQVLGGEVINFTWEELLGVLNIDVSADDNTNSTNFNMTYVATYNRLGVLQASLLIDADEFDKVSPKMHNTVVSMTSTMSPVNSEIDIENTPLIGRYALLETATQPATFFLQFNADGEGYQETVENGMSMYMTDFEWMQTDKGLVAKYSMLTNGEAVSSCDGYSEQECYVSRERHFEILDIVDDRYIVRVFQVFYAMDESGQTYGTLYTSYIGIFNRLNQMLGDVTGTKILLWEDELKGRKEAIQISFGDDGTGEAHADNILPFTWTRQQDYKIDITTSDVPYTETFMAFCEALEMDVEVTKVTTTSHITIYGAPTKKQPLNREARWMMYVMGTDEQSVSEQVCQEQFNWVEDWSDNEVVNVIDSSMLQPLELNNGKYLFTHIHEYDDQGASVFSVALDLNEDGSTVNLADSREFTWQQSEGKVSLSSGDNTYTYSHSFDMLGDGIWTVGQTIDQFGNNIFDAYLVVPFSEQNLTDEDMIGDYKDQSNSDHWWLTFNADYTGGMGNEHEQHGWAWSFDSDVTTTAGMETSLSAITANRYSYVFTDNDNDGEADDMNQDGVVDYLDGEYYEFGLSDQDLAMIQDCETGEALCSLWNNRNYYVVNQSDNYEFWLRDSRWHWLDDSISTSFGLFVFEKVQDSPISSMAMMSNTNHKLKSHARGKRVEKQSSPIVTKKKVNKQVQYEDQNLKGSVFH